MDMLYARLGQVGRSTRSCLLTTLELRPGMSQPTLPMLNKNSSAVSPSMQNNNRTIKHTNTKVNGTRSVGQKLKGISDENKIPKE